MLRLSEQLTSIDKLWATTKGRVIEASAHFERQLLTRSPLYNEFWRPLRIEQQLIAALALDARPAGFLCMPRDGRDKPFDNEDLEVARIAVELLNYSLARFASPLPALLDALVSTETTCAAFDARGEVLFLSRGACALAGDVATVIGGRPLYRQWSRRMMEWREAAAEALAGGPSHSERRGLQVTIHGAGHVAVALVTDRMSMQGRTDNGGHLLFGTANADTRSRRVPEENVAAAVRLWNLSPRQAETLAVLAGGADTKDIANALGCSRRTAEAHVAELLRRSGAPNRTALVSQLWLIGR
jgi:DNA-binding CsgD family transcriptional regulator